MSEAVLILGAGGFIGRALTEAFAEVGTPVMAVGASPEGIVRRPLVEYVPGRVDRAEQLARLVARCGKIIHLATASTPGTSSGQPLREVETNLRLTATLIEILQAQPGKRLMFISSGGSLYADIARVSDENAPLQPRSYHGAAKLAAESFISAWCVQFNGSATILRPSNVYGPGQLEKAGFGVIPTALGKILRNETMHIWGDGTARRDYVYVDDLVRLCMMIFASPAKPGVEILNACSGQSISLNELIRALEEVTGRTLDKVYEQSRRVDASNIAMDPGAAMKAYGWRAQTSIIDGLAGSWKWFQRQYEA